MKKTILNLKNKFLILYISILDTKMQNQDKALIKPNQDLK